MPMTSEEDFVRPSRATTEVEVAGRMVKIRTLSDTQIMQLAHEAAVFSREDVRTERKFKGLDRAFTVMVSLIEDEDDKEFVEDQIAEGNVDFYDLVTALRDIARTVNGSGVDPGAKARRGRRAALPQ